MKEVIQNYGQRFSCNETMVSPDDTTNAMRLLIPKQHLFGTQEKGEYFHGSEKWVKNLQKDKQGMFYLLQHPAIVVAIPHGTDMGLYISDGHHRSRYCARPVVPSLVFSQKDALFITNKENIKRGRKVISLEELQNDIINSSRKALDSFSATLPEHKYPTLVKGVSSMSELPKGAGIRPY